MIGEGGEEVDLVMVLCVSESESPELKFTVPFLLLLLILLLLVKGSCGGLLVTGVLGAELLDVDDESELL